MAADYGKLPVAFEANRGQADPAVRYLAHGPGYELFLTDSESVLALRAPTHRARITQPASTRSRRRHGKRIAPAAALVSAAEHRPALGHERAATVVLRPVAAAAHPTVSGTGELPGKVNYLLGRDRRHWHTGIATYSGALTRGVWPGIDLNWHGTQGHGLEYDLDLAPGVDPEIARFTVSGDRSLRIDAAGDLIIDTVAGKLREHAPIAWQDEPDGTRHRVPVDYRLLGAHGFGFHLGAHDTTRPLTIDPTLVWSTFLGGSTLDDPTAVAVDPTTGDAYVTGATESVDFPVCTGAAGQPTGCTTAGFQTAKHTPAGSTTGFVTELNPTGTGVVYSTYLGGAADVPAGIAVDPSTGDAYVTGGTESGDFPVCTGPGTPTGCLSAGFQTTKNTPAGSRTGFVTELNPTGTGLVYSTYLGGHTADEPLGLALDTTGHAYVTGYTYSSDFPVCTGAGAPTGCTTAGFQTANHAAGNYTGFVTELNPTGTGLVYSTYLGGHTADAATAIALDAAGHAYVTGYTYSNDFPVCTGAGAPTGCTTAAFQTADHAGNLTGFVTELNPTGTGLVYSTYLGGSTIDEPTAVAVDPTTGNSYVTGLTGSADFPVCTGAAGQPTGCTTAGFQTTKHSPAGNYTGFVTELSPTGTGVVYSTYLGGSALDQPAAIALDPSTGDTYIAGLTGSTDFPVCTGPGTPVGCTTAGFQTVDHATGAFTGFLTELNPTGTGLVYSTYLGGSTADAAVGVALGPAGDAYVTGYTESADFPVCTGPGTPNGCTTTAFQSSNHTPAGSLTGFVLEINPAGGGSSGGRGNRGGNNPGGSPPGRHHSHRCDFRGRPSASNDPGPC